MRRRFSGSVSGRCGGRGASGGGPAGARTWPHPCLRRPRPSGRSGASGTTHSNSSRRSSRRHPLNKRRSHRSRLPQDHTNEIASSPIPADRPRHRSPSGHHVVGRRLRTAPAPSAPPPTAADLDPECSQPLPVPPAPQQRLDRDTVARLVRLTVQAPDNSPHDDQHTFPRREGNAHPPPGTCGCCPIRRRGRLHRSYEPPAHPSADGAVHVSGARSARESVPFGLAPGPLVTGHGVGCGVRPRPLVGSGIGQCSFKIQAGGRRRL